MDRIGKITCTYKLNPDMQSERFSAINIKYAQQKPESNKYNAIQVKYYITMICEK